MTDQEKRKVISRRDFLILLGVGSGLLIGVRLGIPFGRLKIAEVLDAAEGLGGIDATPDAWFQISSDNKVTLYLPKVEMGQGVHTALAQIAIEDLGINWDDLIVKQASTNQSLNDPMGTSASSSVSGLYLPLREAAALMREMLHQKGAEILNILPEDLVVKEGALFSKEDQELLITFGEISSQVDEWEFPKEVPPLKVEKDFQFIGKSMDRVDIESKLLGTAIFGFDVKLPNMAYGAIARPPRINAKILNASPGQALDIPDVIEVVIQEDFVGVVAKNRTAAYQGLEALEITWSDGDYIQQADIDALTRVGNSDAIVVQKEGSVNLSDLTPTHTAEYRTGMAYHAHIETQAATADVRSDSVAVWASTQSSMSLQSAIAEALGRDEEEVFVTPAYLGGGFGRKIEKRAAVEAARLSAAVGQPVHIGWSRQEDFRHGFVRPPTHSILNAITDEEGYITAIEHLQASGDVAFPFLPQVAGKVLGADFGAWRGATIPYRIPNIRTVAFRIQLPVPTGWWRGLGLFANVFSSESFMDELADAHSADPVDYRLRQLRDDEIGIRMKSVLADVADQSGWYQQRESDVGYGLAMSIDVNTVVALIAKVAVDDAKIIVRQIFASVDPGLIINPEGARNQILGAITMGVSAALKEEVIIEDGVFVKDNFSRYPLLTMEESPKISINLLSGANQPFGLGEPPIGPVAAAIANAVYNLTGERIRNLPLRFT
jgi:isoquinoline 1-oxidoreductase beta subunit